MRPILDPLAPRLLAGARRFFDHGWRLCWLLLGALIAIRLLGGGA